MSDEMKFKKEYQDTFNEVKASEELVQKVIGLSKTDSKKKTTSFVKKLAVAAAILFSVFVAGNGVVYAATGASILEIAKIYINGTLRMPQIEETIDENDNIWYEATLGEGGVTIGAGDASFLENFPYQFVIYYEVEGVEVIDEANSIYLVDGDVKIDITNELEDGSASGKYEKEGCIYEYEVTEVMEGIWDVRISNKSAVKKVSLRE